MKIAIYKFADSGFALIEVIISLFLISVASVFLFSLTQLSMQKIDLIDHTLTACRVSQNLIDDIRASITSKNSLNMISNKNELIDGIDVELIVKRSSNLPMKLVSRGSWLDRKNILQSLTFTVNLSGITSSEISKLNVGSKVLKEIKTFDPQKKYPGGEFVKKNGFLYLALGTEHCSIQAPLSDRNFWEFAGAAYADK